MGVSPFYIQSDLRMRKTAQRACTMYVKITSFSNGKDPVCYIGSLVMVRASDTNEFQESLNWCHQNDALPCHIHLSVRLWIVDPHSRAAKKNTSHGNKVLPQDTTHLIQRVCYQWRSLCQDPSGNWTTRRPDHCKEAQTEVVWTCLSSSGLAETVLQSTVKGRRRKGRQKKKKRGGKTTSGNGQAWSLPSPREQWKMEKNGGKRLRSHLRCPNGPWC